MRLQCFGFTCLLICFSVLAFVHAEGRCPEGFFPIGGDSAGWEGCAPMGHDPGQNSDQGSNNSRPAEWEPRWGAIAIGGGGWGAVTDMRSEKQAKKAAVKQCRETANGNDSKCNNAFSYYNQCAVIAWGATGYILQGAIDVPTASSIGMQKCASKHAECEIFYSGCSYPKRIQ